MSRNVLHIRPQHNRGIANNFMKGVKMRITVENHEYVIKKLDVLSQSHIAMAISPFLPTLAPLFAALAAKTELDDAGGEVLAESMEGHLERLAAAATPLFELLSSMPEHKSTAIIGRLLSPVSRIIDGRAVPVWLKDAKAPSMIDLSLSAMSQLCAASAKEQLGDFFRVALTLGLSGAEPAGAA